MLDLRIATGIGRDSKRRASFSPLIGGGAMIVACLGLYTLIGNRALGPRHSHIVETQSRDGFASLVLAEGVI